MAVFTNGVTFARLLTFSSLLSFFLSFLTPNFRLFGHFHLGSGSNSPRWWFLHDPTPDHILTRQPQSIAYEQLQSHIRLQSFNSVSILLICPIRA